MPAYDRGNPESFSVEPYGRRIDKPWGYEILLSPPDAPYASKLIHVHAGKRLSLQVHDRKVETQTLVAGRGILVLEASDGELHDIQMQPGLGYHVAIGQRHRLCVCRTCGEERLHVRDLARDRDAALIREPRQEAPHAVRRELIDVRGNDSPRSLHEELHDKRAEPE